jgi:hypothetical protein
VVCFAVTEFATGFEAPQVREGGEGEIRSGEWVTRGRLEEAGKRLENREKGV